MTDKRKMLETICETADMGRDSLDQVLNMTGDDSLEQELMEQRRKYDRFFDSASALLHEMGEEPKKSNVFAKVASQVTASFQATFADNTTPKIADMVIQGNHMGISKLKESLCAYDGEHDGTHALASQLVDTQQANIEAMKRYL